MASVAATDPEPFQPSWRAVTLGYVLMLLAALGIVALILCAGKGLSAPFDMAAASVVPAKPAAVNPLLHTLLALALIIGASRAVGWLFQRLQQPAVVGEIVAGLLIGPSLLGWLAPGVSAWVFPAAIMPGLGLIAQVGINLFLFLVGVELDPARLRQSAKTAVAISHASIVVPFVLGAGLALGLFPVFGVGTVSFGVFALFMGVAMAITAFPVLARILTDRSLHRTPIGEMALTCAAINDVTAWCVLALIVGIAQSNTQGLGPMALGMAGYVAVMMGLVRPWLARLAPAGRPQHPVTASVQVAVLVGLLLSAAATEAIGLHALFGGFFFGVLVPADSALAHAVQQRWHDLIGILLLPVFFALTGLKTSIGLVTGVDQWLWCAAIIVVASIGKFGGTYLAARLTGKTARQGAALGVLMNTRGLMELVVLNIGLELGVISPTVFAMMVLMAVVTTLATSPLLVRILRVGG
ncbi:MAG: cation:proton antiporter [Candidatus Sericytochromatia bacterium]|nr:cation:proton antiporter [Candidatus Sericytochromatia bacterium]